MSKHKKKKSISKNGEVFISPIALLIGIVCVIVFSIFVIISIVQKSYGIAIGFGIFVLLGLILIIAFINCRIYYEPNQFTYKNFFGVKRIYKYNEITGIKYGTSDTIIYVGKKKILVDSMADSNDFLRLVNSKTRNNKNFNQVKEKLFNDNVYNPEEFIFGFSIVPIFAIALMLIINISYKPIQLEDLNYITTQITDYKPFIDEDGNNSILLSTNGYPKDIIIYSYEELIKKFSQFESAVSSGVEFNIYFDKSVEDFESSGTGVDILSDINGNIYISLDSTNARDKENLTTVNIMMSILLVFSIIFMLIAFYVISHADRFPMAIRWFVKEDYIKHKNF